MLSVLTKVHTVHPHKYKNKSQGAFIILHVQCSWTLICFPSFLRKLRAIYLICMQYNVVLCSMVLSGALQCCRMWYEVVRGSATVWCDVICSVVQFCALWCNASVTALCHGMWSVCVLSSWKLANPLADFYKTLFRLHTTAGNHIIFILSYSLS